MPYLYALMHAATRGEAPLRPTFVAFPGDERCHEECDDLMLGPFLLAAPVVAPNERSRRLYLPEGPAKWFDFWTEESFEAGSHATLAAPLERLPLAVPAGAIVVMTDAGEDYSRTHDEPSRLVRIFPGRDSGASRFALTEDDGVSLDGGASEVVFQLEWTPTSITLAVKAAGGYPLPYRSVRVLAPKAETRAIRLFSSEGSPALHLG